MKISIVTSEPTHPCTAGNRARVSSIIDQCIALGYDVRVILLSNDEIGIKETSKHYNGLTDTVKPNDFQQGDKSSDPSRTLKDAVIRSRIILGRILPDSLKIWKKFRKPPCSFDNIDQNMPMALAKRVAEIIMLNKPDVVIINYVYNSLILEFIPATVLKIIDTHDIFTDRYELFKKVGMKPEFHSFTREAEEKGLNRAHQIIAITREEQIVFNQMNAPGCCVVGYIGEMSTSNIDKITEQTVFGILGSANLLNKASLDWLINEVLSEESLINIDFKLVIGGNINRFYINQKLDSRIVFLGMVDYDAFYQSVDVILNPMRVGTGLKFKSCEALACGKPLITTTTGATGLSDGSNRAFMVTDSPKEFALHMEKLATDAKRRKTLADEAAVFMENYMNQQRDTLGKLLSRSL